MNNEITIFVLTTGNNPNLEDCLNALHRQTLQASIEIIKNVYPISKAFQKMFDSCKTKYLVQIDEDMILYPHAIEALYNSMKNASSRIFMSCYILHDVHLDFDMYGVKIFNNDICKNFRLPEGTYSGSLVQISKIKRAGYRDISNKQVLGLHSPKWTNELIFGRYFDLMDKYKARGYRWMGELPFKLYGMFKNNPNELNFFAMMGTITNLLCNKEIPLEKDDSIKNEHYQNLCSLLQQEKPKTFIEKLLPPTTATLSMTTKCSAKCSFCLRQSKTIEQAPDMTVEKIEEILEVFPSIASFALCGFGNPTDCDNFDDIVKFLHKKKLGMGIIVNGIGLKKKIYLLKKHKPNYISISLNAPTQELHEEITKTTNQFDKILEAIQKCVEARITTYLTYVCTTENLVHVPAFLKLAKGLKVSGVHLFNVLPHHLVTNQNKEEFLKLVLTDKNSDDIKKLKQLPEASIVKEFPILINPNDQKRYCRFAWQKLSINGFGNISICNSIFPPEAKNGNIRDANVWTNDYCKNFRDNFIGKLPLPCELCFRNYKRK